MKTIKKKSWWMYPQGEGEPHKRCVVLLCACLNVFMSSFAKGFKMIR
jgi:hypothetical protein